MSNLQIPKTAALSAFRKAGPDGKDILRNLFGEQIFSEKVIDRIKTFEDACAETDENPNNPKFSEGTSDEIAYKKLKVIAKALREGVVLSFANQGQYKYYPWFQYSGSGFRFGATHYGVATTGSAGGSRLCVDAEEKARYFGTQFIDLFNDLLIDAELSPSSDPIPF